MNYELSIMHYLKWFVLFTVAFEVGILEVLHEGESHGVNEGGNHTETEVDAVTEEQDDNHHQFTHHRHIWTHLHRQLVEHGTQHTTCQSECKESDVRKEVAEQSCGHTISSPKSCTEIAAHTQCLAQGRILLVSIRAVEEEDAEG